jgi:hypothetical protein
VVCSCEHGDEPSGSGTMEKLRIFNQIKKGYNLHMLYSTRSVIHFATIGFYVRY